MWIAHSKVMCPVRYLSWHAYVRCQYSTI